MSNRKKNKNVAVILCLFGLIGVGGLHRFYLGKNKTGLLYLFTLGVFWIGTIVDLFRLLKGDFAGLRLDIGKQQYYNSQSTQMIQDNTMVETVKVLKEQQDDIIATEIFNNEIEKGVGEYATEMEFKVVGVTFEGRQLYLEDIFNEGVQTCILRFDIFNNEPCVRVNTNGKDIGYISKESVHFFFHNINKIRRAKVFVFKSHDIYCAKCYVNYYAPRESCNSEYRLGDSYVLNTHNKVVHRNNCYKVNQITSENYSTTNNLSSALNAGYTACGICKPR